MNPSLLVDEADNIITANSNPELLAILNSGHNRKGAFVHRNVPTEDGGWEMRAFSTFAPIALAGIKALPDTLQDRSIVSRLKRAMRGEQKEHLRDGTDPVLVECRRKIKRWMQDLTEIPEPELPPILFNRLGDNWRPLFAIAQIVGGQWPRSHSSSEPESSRHLPRTGRSAAPAALDLRRLRDEAGRADDHEGAVQRPQRRGGERLVGDEPRPRHQ